MGRYLVKINDLKNKNEYLKNKIQTIDDEINKLNKAQENVRWTGPARDKFMINYNNYIEELLKMSENLKKCLKVNEQFYNNYSGGYKKIKKGYQNIKEDLENNGISKY